MPQIENNLTDDPISLAGDTTFSKGQASNVRKNTIIPGAYDIGKNTDFDTFGNIITRRGVAQLQDDVLVGVWDQLSDDPDDFWNNITTKWSNTLTGSIISTAYFDTPTLEKIILAEKDTATPAYKIKIVAETGSIADTGGTFASTASDVYFAQLVDRMYFCDGVGNLQYVDDGSTGQAITAGKITSVRITDKGQGYTTAPTITLNGGGSGSGATFTATLGPSGRVVDIEVGGTPVGGTGYDNSASITLTAAPTGGTDATAEPRVSQIPSKPKLLVTHANRLFCTTADTTLPSDTLYASDLLDGESWDTLGNSIRVGGGDGDPITALMPWFGFTLLVFKERSVWSVNANPSQDAADWEVKLINNRVGCIGHKTVQQVGADVLFLSRQGVQSLSTIEAGAQTDVSTPISAPIQNYIERMTRDQGNVASSAYYNNRYFLAFPIDEATLPTTTFVLNAEQSAWSGYWTGWTPNSFVVTAFDGKLRLQFGDNNGKLYTWLDYVADIEADESYYLDQTAPYETEFISRAYNFDDVYSDKLGYQVEFDLDNKFSSSQIVNFYYVKNMETTESSILQEDSGEILCENGNTLATQCAPDVLEEDVSVSGLNNHYVKAFNMVSKGKFKEVQYSVTADRGRVSLHAIKASAFVDTIDPQR